jgi:hypothetical protein
MKKHDPIFHLLVLFLVIFLIPIVALSLYYGGIEIKKRWTKRQRVEGFESLHLPTSVIPLDIYQTWKTTALPPKMKACVEDLKAKNPEFRHHLYDDTMCRAFIQNNFPTDVLDAFDTLIPGAFKADLWRYCILYKRGGIYLDIKFNCVRGFRLINLTDKEYFVLDRTRLQNKNVAQELKMINDPDYYKKIEADCDSWKDRKVGIYNAVMVCKPGNPVLLRCINKIVRNVKKRDKGYNPFYVTGPGLLGEEYFQGDYTKIRDFELFNSVNGWFVLNKEGKILEHYPEYRNEQVGVKGQGYWRMWHEGATFGKSSDKSHF